MKGECNSCGQCCINPTIAVEVNEDLATFYSYFGLEVGTVGDKFKVRFRTGTVCRHLIQQDKNTMICGIYEDRPQICREYPYENSALPRQCGYED